MKSLYVQSIKTAPLVLLAVLLAGCAGGGKKESVSDTTTRLASVQVTRLDSASEKDCPVSVRISNNTSTAWTGVSYHVSLYNKSGVSIGKLLGSPRKNISSGDDLTDSGKVLGARCNQITGIALVYFGYYPAGKKQVALHNANVQVKLK